MYLLYLSKTKIEVFKNNLKVSETSWNEDNLSEILIRLKTTFSSRFRVLLSDDFISITSVLISKKESKKRKFIQAKAQSIITQNLDQTVWDYKIVANQEKLKLVQIIYLDKIFFDQLRSAVFKAKIKIKLLESLSTSICRFLPKNKLIFLLYQNLVVISFNQTPIFSKVFDKKLTQGDVEEIFAYTKDRFKIFPQQIIFSPTGDTAFSPYDFSSLTTEYLDINPISGLINSPNTVGSDGNTSRLEIKAPSSISLGSSFPTKKIIAILAIFILILIFLVFGYNFFFSPHKTDQLDPLVSISPTMTPVPTPVINLDDITVQVLNGSGVAGEAAKVTNLLSGNKIKVTKTGNALNYDFVKTKIEVKDSIPLQVVDLVTNSLKTEYLFEVSPTKLPQTSEFDIIITTGERNK